MPKRWSTKDLVTVDAPTAARTGTAFFRFTDDYSVFHYGKMPDQIPTKGEALARMASHTMTFLGEQQVPTHFLGFEPPDLMKVRLVRVIDPADRQLRPMNRNRLIPLQVICRNMLPEGASVFRRLTDGTTTLEALNLQEYPVPGQRLPSPLIEFTTKLEEIDRFVTPQEAQHLAGLDDEQFARVKELTLAVNGAVTRHAETIGLVHADSKVEFGIDDAGQVILVDTAGTPDENRFLLDGRHVTKQVLRDYYAPLRLEHDVIEWVNQGRPRSSWPLPPRLPSTLVAEVASLFRSLAERWTGQTIWGEPDLDTLINRLQSMRALHH